MGSRPVFINAPAVASEILDERRAMRRQSGGVAHFCITLVVAQLGRNSKVGIARRGNRNEVSRTFSNGDADQIDPLPRLRPSPLRIKPFALAQPGRAITTKKSVIFNPLCPAATPAAH